MRKINSVVITFVLVLGVVFSFAGCKEETKTKAKTEEVNIMCDENGDFTILVVSDPQCDNSSQWNEAREELETLVERAQPNLVIINGDMNTENKIPADMWDNFISPLTERGIYWATTNGNHDPFKSKYFKMYKSYDKCLNEKVSENDANYEASRPMNYVIPIYSNDGNTPVFAVYGMDTGVSNDNGYEGLTEKQINWYEAQSNILKNLNGGTSVTSILCMHIPLTQTIDMYYSVDGGGEATEKVSGGLYNVYGIINEPDVGISNYVCENGTHISNTWFATTAPANDRGMFNKIQSLNDIKAVFFGHEHQANFIGSYKGVLLGFVGKLSSGCYCDNLCRGGRVVKFNQSAPEKFTVSWLASLETSSDQPAIYYDGSLAE